MQLQLKSQDPLQLRPRSVLLAGALVACLAVPTVGVPESQAQEVVKVHQGVPPKAVRGAQMRDVVVRTSYAGIESTAGFDTLGQKVLLNWFRLGPKQNSTQVESVAFYPTCLAGMDDQRLLVAGKHPRTNATVIEVWELEANQLIPGPVIDGTTGEVAWPDILIPVLHRTVVFESTSLGQDMVFAMFWNLGDPGSAFVQFHDSDDLYSLDFSTKTVTQVVMAAYGSSLPTEPKLAWNFNDKASFDHTTLGYVYMLCRSNSSQRRSLALIDANRDGVLDAEATLSVASDTELPAWYESGVMDSKQISAFY